MLVWNKGDQARLEVGGTAREACVAARADTPWEEARLLGAAFRAIGQEPGWSLELGPGSGLRFSGDYGRTLVTAPLPAAARDSAGAITYQASSGAHDLRVTLRRTPCRDAMSGEAFSHAVSVRMDGRELRGCGRALAAPPLVGTYWKLTELNGRPALPSGAGREAHLRLLAEDGGRVAGSGGCNLLLGSFTQRGQQLRLGPLGMTRMACAAAALNQQEQDYTRMLDAVDRFAIAGDELVLLTGERPAARFIAVHTQP